MPSRAFVARRNGKVFVTGNTGFPKAKSCLKPGAEDWWLAYKPGGKMSPLQIDACRIAGEEDTFRSTSGARNGSSLNCSQDGSLSRARVNGSDSGRWPANVVLDEDAAAVLDEMTGTLKSGRLTSDHTDNGKAASILGSFSGRKIDREFGGDSGGASRFFYTAKASKADRGSDNNHPTVKSTSLMCWLCRLITPPGGTILDPFMGSGSTGKAARLEGFRFIGIEQDPDYFQIASSRIDEARRPLVVGSPLSTHRRPRPAADRDPGQPTLFDSFS